MNEQPPATTVFHEFPDPLVTAFMDRVLNLGADHWSTLDSDNTALWRFPLRMWYPWIKSSVKLRLVNVWIIIMATMGCSDSDALGCYRQFFRNLKLLGLSHDVRSKIARSLLALRARDTKLGDTYDPDVARLIPLDSLRHDGGNTKT